MPRSRMIGLVLIVCGLTLLAGPVAFYFWLHNMYTVGVSVTDATIPAVATYLIVCAACLGFGVWKFVRAG